MDPNADAGHFWFAMIENDDKVVFEVLLKVNMIKYVSI